MDLSKTRRKAYPMVPLGEKLLEANVTCFSGSFKDKPETLILGMHFEISM